MVSKRVVEFLRFLVTLGGELTAWLLFLFKAAEHRIRKEVRAWRRGWHRVEWGLLHAGVPWWRGASNAKMGERWDVS